MELKAKERSLKRKRECFSSGKIECSIVNLSMIKNSNVQSFISANVPKRPVSTLKKIKTEDVTMAVGYTPIRIRKESLNDVKVIGQVNRIIEIVEKEKVWDKVIVTFSLANKTIMVIDQHAVHERIRYEYYYSLLRSTLYENKNEDAYKRFNTKLINLKGSVESQVFKKAKVSFESQKIIPVPKKWKDFIKRVSIFGIEFEETGENSDHIFIRVTATPCLLGEILDSHIIFNACEFFEKSTSLNVQTTGIPSRFDEILMSKACKNAIKFNDKINVELSQKLIAQLPNCDYPLFCVHGRNSIYPLYNLKDLPSALRISRPRRKFNLKFLLKNNFMA